MIVHFPWPPKQLSPNARVHWAKKSKHTKDYKQQCMCAIFAVVALTHKQFAGASKFKLVFSPPDKRKRDADNLIASFKAGFDAMAHMSGVDDSKFEWTYVRGEPVKGGAVIVEVLN